MRAESKQLVSGGAFPGLHVGPFVSGTIESPPPGRTHAVDARESSGKGCLVAETREQCNLDERFSSFGEQTLGPLDPQLDEPLMDRGTETQAGTLGEMTLGKGARIRQFLDRDMSFEMRPQHLLGPELLPRLKPRLRRDGKSRSTTMGLQCMSAEHHRNLIERQPVERFTMGDRRENGLSHLRHDQVLNKEDFLKTEIWSNVVIDGDSLKKVRREVVVQVIEWPPDPHFHRSIQIDERRREGNRARNSDLATVVKRTPLTNRSGR
jgi:hypothetical protein